MGLQLNIFLVINTAAVFEVGQQVLLWEEGDFTQKPYMLGYFFRFLVILAILQKAGQMNSEQNNQIVPVTLIQPIFKSVLKQLRWTRLICMSALCKGV